MESKKIKKIFRMNKKDSYKKGKNIQLLQNTSIDELPSNKVKSKSK